MEVKRELWAQRKTYHKVLSSMLTEGGELTFLGLLFQEWMYLRQQIRSCLYLTSVNKWERRGELRQYCSLEPILGKGL